MTLISDRQMAAIRDLAKKGMVTSVDIYRRDATVPTGSDDYGDNVEYNQTSESRRTTVQGWLYTVPATEPGVNVGAVVTTQTWALRVPVGTEVAVGDRVVVGSDDFYVTGLDDVKTLVPYITCNLRRRLG